MRLTKAICEALAATLLTERKKELEKAQKEFRDFTYDLARKNTPEPILKWFAEYPKFFRGANAVRFKCQQSEQKDYDYLRFDLRIPNPDTDFIDLSKFDYDFLQKEKSNLKKMEEQIDIDEDNLIHSFLQFTTRKKLVDIMPEMEKLLPEETRISVLPDPNQIRNIIQGSL